MNKTRENLIKWGWTNGNGQPLSWKYWWTYWRKKEEDEERRYARHNELMHSAEPERKRPKWLSTRDAAKNNHES